MLIIETGNYQSVSRIEAGDRWWGYAKDHRWYFSPANLALLLKRVGYRYVYYYSRALRPWWQGTRNYEGPSPVQTLKKIVRNPLAVVEKMRIHQALQMMPNSAGEWAGLGIFTAIATIRPINEATKEKGLIEL
jgi:hypothetical protein